MSASSNSTKNSLYPADADDPRWPTYVALGALSAFVVGTVVATSDFADPRILYNAWVRLGGAAVLLGLLWAGLHWLEGRMLRRLQFCILVSLLAHLGLAVYLQQKYLLIVAQREAAEREANLPRPPITIPDYQFEEDEQPSIDRSFEAPVETFTPDAQSVSDSRREPVPEELPRRPMAEEAIPRLTQLGPVEVERVDISPPRRAEDAGGPRLSRRDLPRNLGPGEHIPEPSPLNEQASRQQRLTPDDTDPVRRLQTADAQRAETDLPRASGQPEVQLPDVASRSEPSPRRTAAQLARVEPHDMELPVESLRLLPGQIAARPPEPQLEASSPSHPRTPGQAAASSDASALPSVALRSRDLAEFVPRAAPAMEQTPVQQSSTRSTTPRRALSGFSAPSTAIASPLPATAAPALRGTAPESRLEASVAAVSRGVASQAPRRGYIAAEGRAELAAGTGMVASRLGQPRAQADAEPSTRPTSEAGRAARSRSGTSLMAAPLPPVAPLANVAARAQERAGGPVAPSAVAESLPARRGGLVSAYATRAQPGAGVDPVSGDAAPVGLAQPTRVTRHETAMAHLSGGGSPVPTRRRGPLALPGSTAAEGAAVAMTAPGGSQAIGSPLDAAVAGQDRQVAGLPGSRVTLPGSGAIAALNLDGAPLPHDIARRAPASQLDNGGFGTRPSATATLKRSAQGIELPTWAETAPSLALLGAGGVGEVPTTATSTLEPGEIASLSYDTTRDGRAERAVASEALAVPTGEPPPALDLGPLAAARVAPPARQFDSPSASVPNAHRPMPRRGLTALAVLPQAAIEGPQEPAAEPGKAIQEPRRLNASGAAQLERRVGGLPVQIAAAEGPGGLLAQQVPDVGLPSRRARPESESVHTIARRFLPTRAGGALTIDGRVMDPKDIYARRDPGRRGEAAAALGGTEGTERAVELGLEFLARMQFEDGHWAIDQLPPGVGEGDAGLGQMRADTAATGLALLAYLGAGYTHVDEKHRDTVRRGILWLTRNQKRDGDLFTGGSHATWFYSHGIASIALCEAYGMTQDPMLREPARKAIDFIIVSQEPQLGGWRYAPRMESDSSVTGWQLQALRSAQMAGLEVPNTVLEKVEGWLDVAAVPDGRYVYNPLANPNRVDQREGRMPNLAMTAECMLMRLYLGRSRDDDRIRDGAAFLALHPPKNGTSQAPERDCYYWYYATQTMFHMRGEYWTSWNHHMRAVLESSQVQRGTWAGSWHPNEPVADRWAHAGGRVYVTALHLLMLEVYYRHLPLFQELTK
ncbi:MAG: hypothetical protein ACOY3P_22645 [Planctomycetota bacterium]